MIKNRKPILTFILIVVFFPLLFLSLFTLLQDDQIYNSTIGRISNNYVYTGNWDKHQIVEEKVAYTELCTENLEYWDAMIYNEIKNDMYEPTNGEENQKPAFFPLFPMIWKISGLDSMGIMLLNYIFFAAGLFILFQLFVDPKETAYYLTFCLVFPSSVIFMIPYSEACFFLLFSIAAYGAVKKNYLLYFIGILLMAMTRPAGLFAGIAILAADLCISVRDRKKTGELVISALKKIFPFIVGFLSALFIEFLYTEDFFSLFEAQKSWGGHFSLPTKISDWSIEGFGITTFSVFFISIPCLIFTMYLLYSSAGKRPSSPKEEGREADFIFYTSVFYVAGMFLFLLFYSGGNLYSYSRLTLATPFFFCIVLALKRKIEMLKPGKAALGFLSAAGIMTIVLLRIDFGKPLLSYKYTGLYLALALSLLILVRLFYNDKRIGYVFFPIAFIAVLWQTYLLNMLLSDAWIFT
jgi:hypothetical protein